MSAYTYLVGGEAHCPVMTGPLLLLLLMLPIPEHVVFLHLVLDPLPDLCELDACLQLREGLGARALPLVLGGAGDRGLYPLHAVEEEVPRTHVQEVAQAVRDVKKRLTHLKVLVGKGEVSLGRGADKLGARFVCLGEWGKRKGTQGL
jgi:hypothetical protein